MTSDSDPAEQLRQLVEKAWSTASAANSHRSSPMLNALSAMSDALAEECGIGQGSPPTAVAQAVARAMLGVDGEGTEWCVFWGGPDPDIADEVNVRDDREDAESFAKCLDPRVGVGVASRAVTYGPWRVETPGGAG